MKSIYVSSFLFLLFVLSCTKENNSSDALTLEEQNDLIFLRQEEKLAHDVYTYVFKKYGLTMFDNISNSEATHQEQMLTLLHKYNIPDPVAGYPEGKFLNNELQLLYGQLIEKVEVSMADALEVGATIEDVDIRDTDVFYTHTNRTDIKQAFDLLKCGSGNHLRAFTGQLTAVGKTYVPKFIDNELFQAILKGSHEHCGG